MYKLIRLFVISIALNFCFSSALTAEDLKKLRIGSLQYGSVNWELKLIKEFKLDNKNISKVNERYKTFGNFQKEN